MQKFLNRPERAVAEMIEGAMALDPELWRLGPHYVLTRPNLAELSDRQVTIVSGGGSGHEPAHAGYVGAGMLTAAVAGEIFTSPGVDAILAAIRAVGGRHGVLLIVKNYTGDRLNFGVAAEMARAEGLEVESVIVGDDVALPDSDAHAGRRGLAGTVLVHKIAGAAAAAGRDLPQVATIAQAAAESVATMGVALSAGTSFVSGKAGNSLDGQLEIGLGIHGEPGLRRVAMRPADEVVDSVLDRIVEALRLRVDEAVAVLVNNLGATTALEMAIAARHALGSLEERGLRVERLWAGTYLSSLDMEGLSISVMRLDGERRKWLDAPTSAPAWRSGVGRAPGSVADRTFDVEGETEVLRELRPQTWTGRKTEAAIKAACGALVAATDELTELDRLTGDGDLGHNLRRAAEEIERQLPTIDLDDGPGMLRALGRSLQRQMGGSSGPLYGVLFLRGANALETAGGERERAWAAALLEGCSAASELGGARLGDRTMLDALIPFAAGLAQGGSLEGAAAAAENGARQTAHMTARRGRSSYLGDRVLGTPDPGAVAAAIWLRAVASALTGVA